MKRVLVTLVSIGLIAGMAALIPLLAGDPASAATPCTPQRKAVVRAQQRVNHDRAKTNKDRRHHRAAAVKKDRKKLAADQRKLKTARLHYQLCQARHKPAKTTTATATVTATPTPSPSTSSGTPSGVPTGLPSGFPTSLPTDPSSLCTLFGQPSDCLPSSGIPTDPTAVCSALGIPASDCPPTALPTPSSSAPTASAPTTSAPTSSAPGLPLPLWVTSDFGASPSTQVVNLLETAFGNPLPSTAPANALICTAVALLPSSEKPSSCSIL